MYAHRRRWRQPCVLLNAVDVHIRRNRRGLPSATAESVATLAAFAVRLSARGEALASNLETRRLGRVVVVRQNAEPPSDQEWAQFLEILREGRADFERLRVLVLTEGGGPNAAQRESLARTLAGKTVRVAIVTDSIAVRFTVTVIALFHKDIRSFLTSELRKAHAHLGLQLEEVVAVERELATLAALLRPSKSR